jgi:hypothetical protein
MRQNCRSPGAISILGRIVPFTVKISSTFSDVVPHFCDGTSTRLRELRSIGIVLDGAATHNNYSLAKMAYFGDIAFHPLDNDRSRHAVQHLTVALAMRVGVVPEETRKMIRWNMKFIVQDITRLGKHRAECVPAILIHSMQ